MTFDKKTAPAGGQTGHGAIDTTNESILRENNKVKLKLKLREFLRAKGIEPNNSGFIPCLWHTDRTPSCKVNDEYVHCFTCGESGDIYKVAAALLGLSCDKEHFREIAAEVERTLGVPEWKPLPQSKRGPPGYKLSKSSIYRDELLKEFAKAIDAGDMETAYYRACLLFALFLLPEGEPESKVKKPTLQERMAGYGIRERYEQA
jgi:hypothetical protein